MNTPLRKILVIGGNGFIGSSVCKSALARGIQVTSVSSSGRPYQTNKGHTPAWASKVDWRQGDALRPDSFADIFPEVDGVVHTLGILIEDTRYKQALQEGNLLSLASSFYQSLVGGQGNPLERTCIGEHGNGRNSYEVMNRDAALRVCEAFVDSTPAEHVQNAPRPFIYVSAEDIFRPMVPARYIETKREAETGIEALVANKPESYRAALLDLSATLHSKVPSASPTPSNVLRALSAQSPRSETGTSTSPLESMANALVIPPIHVDTVAEAICVALDSSLRGVVGVDEMRKLIGWSRDGNVPAYV